jgi:hypothetical protein
MFARFRHRPPSLYASIVESRRQDGRVQQVHVANLGSIDERLAGHALAIERWRFWRKVNERLSRLANRITPADDAAIRTAVYTRIPMPTPDEVRAAAIWEAERDAALWQGQHQSSVEIIKVREHLIASAQSALVDDRVLAERDAQRAAEASARRPSEPRTDRRVTLKELGIDKHLAARARKLGAMTKDEFEAWLEKRRSRRGA